MPALRERREDIPELVKHFLAKSSEEGLPWKMIDQKALEKLQVYDWPGNVRELENVVRRLAALYSQETIGVDVIEAELLEKVSPIRSEDNSSSISEAVEMHVLNYFTTHNGTLPLGGLYDKILKEVERPLITNTLAFTRGNQLKSAELLGLNRNTLRKKIQQLNIPVVRAPK
jgi:two-component system nitrogen regulation response regulator GlnG